MFLGFQAWLFKSLHADVSSKLEFKCVWRPTKISPIIIFSVGLVEKSNSSVSVARRWPKFDLKFSTFMQFLHISALNSTTNTQNWSCSCIYMVEVEKSINWLPLSLGSLFLSLWVYLCVRVAQFKFALYNSLFHFNVRYVHHTSSIWNAAFQLKLQYIELTHCCTSAALGTTMKRCNFDCGQLYMRFGRIFGDRFGLAYKMPKCQRTLYQLE